MNSKVYERRLAKYKSTQHWPDKIFRATFKTNKLDKKIEIEPVHRKSQTWYFIEHMRCYFG